MVLDGTFSTCPGQAPVVPGMWRFWDTWRFWVHGDSWKEGGRKKRKGLQWRGEVGGEEENEVEEKKALGWVSVI